MLPSRWRVSRPTPTQMIVSATTVKALSLALSCSWRCQSIPAHTTITSAPSKAKRIPLRSWSRSSIDRSRRRCWRSYWSTPLYTSCNHGHMARAVCESTPSLQQLCDLERTNSKLYMTELINLHCDTLETSSYKVGVDKGEQERHEKSHKPWEIYCTE